MSNTIEVKVKQIYGIDKLYIVSDHASAIFDLTNRKTLTNGDIQALKALGFEVVEQQKAITKF